MSLQSWSLWVWINKVTWLFFLDQKFSLVSFAHSPYHCPARLWLKGTAEVSKHLTYSCTCNISGPAKTRILLLPLTTGWLKSVLPGWLFKRCDCQTQPSSVYFLCWPSFPEVGVTCPEQGGALSASLSWLFYCSAAQRVFSYFFLCNDMLYSSLCGEELQTWIKAANGIME